MGAVMGDRVARFVEMTSSEREGATLDEMVQRMTGAAASRDGVTREYEGLPEICALWDVPYGKFLLWLQSDAARYGRYKVALELQAHGRVAEVVSIVDSSPNVTEKGAVDSADVAHKKLRAETRLKLAQFHAPEMYRERREVDVTVRHDLAARLIAARGRVAAIAADKASAIPALVGESRVVTDAEVL